eukprot:384991_1
MSSNSCLNYVGTCYDILAQTISILDVVTDIIVCIEFYQNDRMIFFGISLSILCLALIAYTGAFIGLYSDEYRPLKQIGLFLSLLPISPFIPFVIYYVNQPKKDKFARYIEAQCCYNISFYGSSTSSEATKFKQFFESKIERHLGFILESLVEAFPQAILQMTAIVMFDETNIVSIISILISLLSVASKSLVFSFGTASNFKQLAFNWLCAVTDFFGIFFVVCWVFYEPIDPDLKHAFITIRNVWLYKLYIFEFPMIAFVSIVLHALGTVLLSYEITGIYKQILASIFGVIGVTIAWACGIIASLLVCEITGWTWLGLTFVILGTERFPNYHKLSLQFYFTIIAWINAAKKHHIGSKYKGCTSYTKHQDRMMRLASANYIMNKDDSLYSNDHIFMAYLEKEKNENQYMNVTMNGLRDNTQNRTQSLFIYKFWEWYSDAWKHSARSPANNHCKGCIQRKVCPNNKHECTLDIIWATAVGSLTVFFGPIYFLSRFVMLFYPGFIVVYLYFGYDVNIWNTDSIHIFQIVMITIYIILCAILSVLFYFNAKEQYLMAHLQPAKRTLSKIKNDTNVELKIKEITNHYYGITIIPIRRAMIIEKFGPDLGPIIVSFLPTDDTFDIVGDVVTVKTVV